MVAVPLPVLTVAGGMVHIHTYLRAILDDEEQVMLRYVITAPVWAGSVTMPSRRARPRVAGAKVGSQIESDPPAQSNSKMI